MGSSISPRDFVEKWRKATIKERPAVQEHFIDLCHLVGHPTPAEEDPTGANFTFEAGATKQSGGQGWADVWKRGYFSVRLAVLCMRGNATASGPRLLVELRLDLQE